MTRRIASFFLLRALAVLPALVATLPASAQTPLGTAFTYQGALNDAGSPADGVFDFEFRLYRDADGADLAGSMCVDDLVVSNGFVSAELDFGAEAFSLDARWLEVRVRPGLGVDCADSPETYTPLSPRRRLTPSPHSRFLGTGEESTIGGGGENMAQDMWVTVGGGFNNMAGGTGATIAGGIDNIANNSDATVSGGSENTASGVFSVVGGGSGNTASEQGATVGGGFQNTVSGEWATVDGGRRYVASYWGAVGGGEDNVASNDYATVSGGEANASSGRAAAIGGGSMNIASGSHSAVGGGDTNEASGLTATVPGGSHNIAEGERSFAAGFGAHAMHEGAFVWADAENFHPLASTAANEFTARATGGFRFISAVDASGLPTEGVVLLPGASAWAPLGARGAPSNVQAPLGADGPAMAAIHDLAETVRGKDAELQALRADRDALEARVARLEALVENLAAARQSAE